MSKKKKEYPLDKKVNENQIAIRVFKEVLSVVSGLDVGSEGLETVTRIEEYLARSIDNFGGMDISNKDVEAYFYHTGGSNFWIDMMGFIKDQGLEQEYFYRLAQKEKYRILVDKIKRKQRETNV